MMCCVIHYVFCLSINNKFGGIILRINKFLAGVTLACTLMIGAIGFLGSGTVQAADVASATTLSAPSKVTYGKNFTVDVGLQSVTNAVYAQDFKIQYNATLMEFVSAASLIDGIAILEEKESPGSVRIIMASKGAEHGITKEAVIAALTFKAKQLELPAIGTISVDAQIGDGYGIEVNAASSSVQIGFEIVPVELSPDINGDGKVSIGDLAIVAANYGKTSADSDWEQAKRADVNGDGKIDVDDLALIAKKILG